jgi:hypothetical protein
VIQRQGDGFLLDQNRIAYLRFLRREQRRSPARKPTLITQGQDRDAAAEADAEET